MLSNMIIIAFMPLFLSLNVFAVLWGWTSRPAQRKTLADEARFSQRGSLPGAAAI